MPLLPHILFGLTLLAIPAGPLAAQDAPSQSLSDTPSVTLKLEVRRVPLDIVVTGKTGNPVRGLQEDDFIVKEDHKLQKPLSFDYFDGSSNPFVPPKIGPLPPNTFVNLPTEAEHGPLYVLYYDMVNTSMQRQGEAHNQLLAFIDHAQPGTRMAIFVNAAGLHLVQGFTSDHAKLHAAILYKGPGPHIPSVFLEQRVFGFEDAGAVLSNMKFMADYLNGIPGRKNLLWLSSEFPIPVGPAGTGHNSDTGVAGGFSSTTMQTSDLSYLLSETIKETYSALSTSQVALYPVDLNGTTGGDDDLSNNQQGGDAVANYQYEDQIAQANGGRAYHGSNSLSQMLDKAIDNGANYYALTYSPTNTKYDGTERHIEVSLANKPDYTLSYRTIYYGISDDDPKVTPHKTEGVLQARFVAEKTADNLYANIEHGAPMLHDLLFSAHVAAQGKPQMATPVQMLLLEDSPIYFRTRKRDKPVKPPAPVKLQKYVIGYGVIDQQLKASAKDRGVPAVLEFAAAAYDADGRLLNSMLNEGTASTGASQSAKQGALFHAEQDLEVPPGAAWLRLAVRDKLSNRTGTLEVPLPLASESKK